ncbi:MAG: Mur ligase family protein [Spirochaetota bacterium]
MPQKRLSTLLGRVELRDRRGSHDPVVHNICHDSRDVTPGSLFVATRGFHTDGHDFIEDALAGGAVALVVERGDAIPEGPGSGAGAGAGFSSRAAAGTGADAGSDSGAGFSSGADAGTGADAGSDSGAGFSSGADAGAGSVPVAVVADARRALSALAAAFYDDPSHELFVIGVTGTDGKSSTASFTEQILNAAGYPTGLVSTVSVKTGETTHKNPNRQSTPEPERLHGYLADMRDAGRRFAVVEATSHGLSLRTARLADVQFRAAVFTNLSHEHLEFHGTLDQYRSDKANLFRALDGAGADAFGVVNAADEHAPYMAGATGRPVFRYGIEEKARKNPSPGVAANESAAPNTFPAAGGAANDGAADRTLGAETAAAPSDRLHLSARDLSPTIDGTSFTLADERGNTRRVCLPMPGTFQVENVLAALLAASRATGRSPLELADVLDGLEAVDGRLVPVGRNLPFAVVVDYAHTPNSYEKLFPIIRASTPGRIVAVFGSAGERDVEKRPLQGAVAARHAELIVICDEDPRGEDGQRILDEIAAGVAEAAPEKQKGVDYLVIPDRRQAIREAIDRARPGDTVVLLGKGHESSMIYADGPRPWNEAEVARAVLSEAGYAVEGGAEEGGSKRRQGESAHIEEATR